MQKVCISVYAKRTNALWQGKWKRILIPRQVQLPGTPLCCLLRPSVPFWHSSKMLAGCLPNTEETVLEVAPLKVCQTSVCVNRTGCSRGNDPIRGFWIHTWMFLPCSMFLDGMPGLTNRQSVSRLVQASAQISLSVPLDRIKLWSLHNQMLTIKRCLFLTRASQALLCYPTVEQKLYKVNTDNYYHLTCFLWSVSFFVSAKLYSVYKVHFWNRY